MRQLGTLTSVWLVLVCVGCGGEDVATQGISKPDEDTTAAKATGWLLTGGGPGAKVSGASVAVDPNGHALFAGSVSGKASLGAVQVLSTSVNATLIGRIDPSGQAMWAVVASGSGVSNGRSLAIDGAGNGYVIGTYSKRTRLGPIELTAKGSTDVFVAKVANSGVVQWARSIAGADSNYGLKVDVDTNGNSLVCGHFETSLQIYATPIEGKGQRDIFVARLTPDGKYWWAKGGRVPPSGVRAPS